MRSRLALAGLLAGAAAFAAPAGSASAYCQEPLIVLDDGSGGGGGQPQCSNGCEDTARMYEDLRRSAADVAPLPQDPFVCMH